MFNASHNQITKVKKYYFEDLTKLQKLDLSHNEITELQSNIFFFIRNIEHINVSYNKIEEIESDILSGLSYLQTLDLSFNQLSSDNFIDGSNQLLYLNLSGNNYNRFNISKLIGLNEIRLDDNPWNCKWLVARMVEGDDKLKFGYNFTVDEMDDVLNVPGIDCNDNGISRSLIILETHRRVADYYDEIQVRNNSDTRLHVNDDILYVNFNSTDNITLTNGNITLTTEILNNNASVNSSLQVTSIDEKSNKSKYTEDPFDAKAIIIWFAIALILVFGLAKYGRHVLTKSERKTDEWRRSQQVSYYTNVSSANASENTSAEFVSFYAV